MHIIKTVADVKQVAPGDSYLIDVWPPFDSEDQTITEEMLRTEATLQSAIDKHLLSLKQNRAIS